MVNFYWSEKVLFYVFGCSEIFNTFTVTTDFVQVMA